ncbi:hypothetical protein [Fusibacter ferrireducens]|uniref:Mpv17 / PMP22 family protein n=1 Tax=Fusibacter ferrireducens TaxID=2785058 RepID=A0ABR9ZQX7_9FIRM|nr:hypothetical protein [Fusibacter ferrireducens]MBF4692857.1 hypothetical protein [Fusibacter ferrireducens]
MRKLDQSDQKNQIQGQSQILGDFIWAMCLLCWILILVVPSARSFFIKVTEAHPYMGGFFKFTILASMGDLLGFRILNNRWKIPQNVLQKAFVWGIIGMMVTLIFSVYMGGVSFAQSIGRLPFAGHVVAQAFLGSFIMNVTFGPMMYVYHIFGDKLMASLFSKASERPTLKEMVDTTDWYTLVSFSWLKTCLFVWVPCHTIVFLMPSEYRVLASAFLSILLGLIIAYSKKNAVSSTTTCE